MAETSTNPKEEHFKDHLITVHPDGPTEKIPLPEDEEARLRIGRELDNEIVLTDMRASRYHAEIRLAKGVLEVKDLHSANGVLINQSKIEPDTWTRVLPGQKMQLAETSLTWQKATSSASTVTMTRQEREVKAAAAAAPASVAAPAAAPAAAPTPPVRPQSSGSPMLPWVIGLGIVVIALVVVGILSLFLFGRDDPAEEAAGQATTIPVTDPTATSIRGSDSSLAAQTPVGGPTSTSTPVGPQLAIPILEIISLQVSPIIFGASPSTNRAYIFIDVRARNSGNIPFEFSISNFTLQTREGEILQEAGATTSENYLRQLGAIDRFENLGLTPGGSVLGSLVFELDIDTYDFDLVFQAPNLSPLSLGLGSINMDRELKLAAGTPAAALDIRDQSTPTPTVEPTPTATRPPLIPAPQVVARSALAGTIAYPVFNGTDFDIYFGQVDGSGSQFFRARASQPAFSPDGSRIAFHSWDNSSRGLMAMDVSGANAWLIASFAEDQLPTWSPDGSEIILLSRRSGARKSELITVGSATDRTDGITLGEGEYPTVSSNGQIVFKGWGNTAFGLRLASPDFSDIKTITNVEEDTAPILSPDGERIAFMSRREGNWDIYIINTDGSNLQQLTIDPAQDGLPTWSPDGNALAFVSDRGGNWAIWVMTPEGKGQSQRFSMEGSPDGFVGTDNFASRGWAEERISWTE